MFWRTRKLAAMGGDVERVTRAINGGMNGLEDRRHRYDKALSVLS